ncbi:hypothetical protein PAXRUDRAFT_21692 [Paxillus rubicundulus Ve08.2h10]|uniref:Uncharacterized protein n=1 Tax=Paxillus rubicundulus Ve08.2h10 TaxID=930991 RepID=A0A0D0BLX5_9AGAM|nr:hypothetical protein PAXRUDRAFT_21692 [Paxillus rubicundulus Ve08.2h10]
MVPKHYIMWILSVTSKVLVTPSNQAPSLGPSPSTSKKAKAPVSKLRPKTPSVAQKAKFNQPQQTASRSITPLQDLPPQSIPWASALKLISTPVNPLLDAQPGPSLDPKDQIIKALEVHVASLEKQVERIPDLELQLSSMVTVVEALQEQVTGPACISLSPDAETPFPSSHLSPSADGGKLAPSPLHLHMHQQPHLGVEMEDDASGEGSNDNAGPPLPIPPPFTDLVPPIESFSSKSDMELEDVDME